MNIQLPSLAGAAAAGLPPRRRGRRPPAGAAVGKILLVINHSKERKRELNLYLVLLNLVSGRQRVRRSDGCCHCPAGFSTVSIVI